MKVKVSELRAYCNDVLTTIGMPADEAEIFTGALMHADQRGVKSHGVMAFERYTNLLLMGAMQKKASYTAVIDSPAVAVWDANRSCAHVIGHWATLAAIEKAKISGLGMIGVRNSNHFGAGAYYSKLISDADMIGIVSSTAGPTMAPWGGKEKQIGNNPLALSAPTITSPTVTLDIAQSVVAMGKIANLKTQGIPDVPEGWAYDKDGNPTTKTADVYSIVPFGGYKGFGLSFFIDIISGILVGGCTGARCAEAFVGFGGPSHSFLAINPKAFACEPDVFKQALEDRIAEFKSCPKKDGVDTIYMPGEIEEICYNNSQEETEIINEVVDQLNAVAVKVGSKARVSGVK